MSEVRVTSPSEIIETLMSSNYNRTTEPTKMNEVSSRSHAVLSITVEYRDRTEGTSADVAIGKLSMIDLAGSERAAKTQNRG